MSVPANTSRLSSTQVRRTGIGRACEGTDGRKGGREAT
jgi:hypothetical protein